MLVVVVLVFDFIFCWLFLRIFFFFVMMLRCSWDFCVVNIVVGCVDVLVKMFRTFSLCFFTR